MASKIDALLAKAAPFALAHGICRKAIHVWDAEDLDYRSGARVPLLWTTKGVVCAVGALSNVCLWPINLLRDARELDVALQKPQNVLEHLIR